MNQPILAINDLKANYRVFGGELKVIDGLNLEVRKGEKVGLVGETGCGKTTTMKSILRILPKPAGLIKGGEIIFEGKDLLKLKESSMVKLRREKMSAIFQNPSAALNPVFTVGEQLFDAIKYSRIGGQRVTEKKEIKKKALEVLKDVALPDPERLLTNYPFQLSGGMKQRICIALALVTTSDLLIADEPTTNLDVTIQDQILRLLIKLIEERQTSTIYITHSLGLVRQFMDRVYVMYAGSTVEVAKTNDLFKNPRHPYTIGLLKAVPKLTGGGISLGIPGRVPDYLKPPEGCRFYSRCEGKMEICEKEKPKFTKIKEDHMVACFREEE